MVECSVDLSPPNRRPFAQAPPSAESGPRPTLHGEASGTGTKSIQHAKHGYHMLPSVSPYDRV